MPTLLLDYAGTPALTHTLTFTATAGKTVIVVATAAATLTATTASQTAGWVRDVYPTPGASAAAVFRLPGASNPGGSISLGIDLNGSRTCAAVVFEGAYTGTPNYSNLAANAPSSNLWGTGGHTFSGSATRDSFAIFTVSRGDASFADISSYDNSYVELGDSGLAVDGGSNESSRVWVAWKNNQAFTSNGVTATLSSNPSWGTGVFTGFANYDFSSNIPPTANAGIDQSVNTLASVTLDGSGSSDSDGTIASYAWTQTAGTTVTLSGSGATRTFTAPTTPGTLTFQLTVTDNLGATGTDTVDIVVNNQSPVANAGVDQSVNTSASVTLDGSGSSDPDGTISTYTWTQTLGTAVTLSGTGATRTFTAPNTPGSLTFQLTVTDNNGATNSDTIVVTVNNRPPVANAGPDQNVALSASVTLTGAASSDPDGTISTYAWTQLSGTTVTLSGTGATRTFTAPGSAGSLVFQLTVTDNGGATSTDTVAITVGTAIDKVNTTTDLEMTFFRTATGVQVGTLTELKERYYKTALGIAQTVVTRSLKDLERSFYLNALTLTTGSLQDLKRKYYILQTGRSDLSTTDLERQYFKANTP